MKSIFVLMPVYIALMLGICISCSKSDEKDPVIEPNGDDKEEPVVEPDRQKITFEIIRYNEKGAPGSPGDPLEGIPVRIYNGDETLSEDLVTDNRGIASALIDMDKKYYYRIESDSLSDVYDGWKIAGVFASQEEIDQAPRHPGHPLVPGALRFEDLNGDGLINREDKGDWKYTGEFTAGKEEEKITVYLISGSFEIDYPVKVYTHPLDNRILFVAGEDGSSTDVYGTKDENGIPVSIDRMVIKDAEDSETTILLKDGMPSVYYLPSGFVCRFEWDSPTSASVTVMDPTGENTLHTYVDFARSANLKSKVRKQDYAQRKSTGKSRITFEDIPKHTGNMSLRDGSVISDGSSYVYLTRCDQPYNVLDPREVGIIMNRWDEDVLESSGYITTLTPQWVSDGKYVFNVPDAAVPHASAPVSDLVRVLSSLTGSWCETYGILSHGWGPEGGTVLCASLSAALLASPLFETAPGFAVVCEGVIVASEVGCVLFDLGGSQLMEGFANFVDISHLKEPYQLIPYVIAHPEDLYGEYIVVHPGHRVGNLSVDMGGTTRIERFYLSPPNPGKGVNYEAIADVSCIRSGSSVTMSILGTDGYYDTVTTDFPEGVLNQRCILWVPGAAVGVRDYCSIEIEAPDGTKTTRNASLVFGP
jgi:hypothetical protein